MPLKISLKPGERFVLNGAVLQNGERRTSLVLQNKASILREKDIMQESDVTSPARHIYFPIMLMYLDPENAQNYYETFALRTTEFMNAISSADGLGLCVAISKDVMAGEYYKALMKAKKLMAFESERLAYVSAGVSENSDRDRQSA